MIRLAACVGQDDEEDRASARMHCLQIQDAARYQALQAVRPHLRVRVRGCCLRTSSSFELGGEKKTKGAALQFVSILSYQFMPCVGADCSCSNRLCIVSLSLSRYPYHRCHYLPSAHYVVCTPHAYATTHVTKLYSYGSERRPWITARLLVCD